MLQIKKRGSIHIDWVISVGIFLTFVVIVIAFVKPSYNPEFEGRVLLDLVEQKLKEKSEWKVKRNLLNVKCESSGVKSFSLSQHIPGLTNFKLLKEDMTPANSLYKNSIDLKLNSGINRFFVIHSPASYGEGTLEATPDNPDCEISAANPVISKGLRKNKLNINELQIENWNFPKFRQFRIQILNSNGSPKGYCFSKDGLTGVDCENIQIPEQVQIYAADKGTTLLDKDLNKEQIILNILVW